MNGRPGYWAKSNNDLSRGASRKQSSGDIERTAEQVVTTCGIGKMLDIGSAEGDLVAALLRRGVDARGLDASEAAVAHCNDRMPGRFVHGSALALPYENDAFDTIVATDCMEYLAATDVSTALGEIRRVTRRYVFLKIATIENGNQQMNAEGRAWWETKCFNAGFRKHSAYYKINNYEALNQDGWQICILLEKIPTLALEEYPLSALNEERGLHMDMLRDTGERSDAHVIRYQWACDYIKAGDRVLDAACGLGYGGHIIINLAHAVTIVGVDGSEYGIDYASKSYGTQDSRLSYQVGMLPEALVKFPDGSFDTIISFETLEHVENPVALLREFHRVLVPGGRIIVSVPNDWSDETGEDPNPFHLHVYDWRRLKGELEESFDLEEAFAQTASQFKDSTVGNAWSRQPRALYKVEATDQAPVDCEWWLMVAMKSPSDATVPYIERVYRNIIDSAHHSIDYAQHYDNPWLMYAMVNYSTRLKDDRALGKLVSRVSVAAETSSNDYAAALCVEAYRCLRGTCESNPGDVIAQIDQVLEKLQPEAMGLRWKVSLLFVKASLQQSIGQLLEAKNTFVACAEYDVRRFGIHLATKTTESWFSAGLLAYSLCNIQEAKSCWQRGVDYGRILLSVSIDDILINPSFPNRFNHGDGIREYTIAWDNIARCANGLHLLQSGESIDYSALVNCLQTEYSTVTRDLLESRLRVKQVVASTTVELKNMRDLLIERTNRLESCIESLEAKDRYINDLEVRAQAQAQSMLGRILSRLFGRR